MQFMSSSFPPENASRAAPDLALFRAIDKKDAAEVKRLLGVAISLREKFTAALRGTTATASIEARNEDGFTPLHRACMGGDVGIVKILLDAGADLHAENGRAGTALSLAAINNQYGVVDELLAHGFDLNGLQHPTHADPVCQAVHHGRYKMAVYLLDKGADPIREGREEHNALTQAAERGDIDFMKLLISRGIDINKPDPLRLSPLMYAAEANKKEMTAFLLDHGAQTDIDRKCPKRNWTALCYALHHGHAAITALLLVRGADPYTRVGTGVTTPYDVARNSSFFYWTKALLKNYDTLRKRGLAEQKARHDAAEKEKQKKLQAISEISLKGSLQKIPAQKSIRFVKK